MGHGVLTSALGGSLLATVDYVYQVGFHQINIICYVTLFVYY
jgi:hypothetical protein